MWKVGNLKKLKNNDLHLAAMRITNELRYNVWSEELASHLSHLEQLTANLLDANNLERKNKLTPEVQAASNKVSLAYRKLYLHLKTMTLEESPECVAAAHLLLKHLKLSAYTFERLKQDDKVQYLNVLAATFSGANGREYFEQTNSTQLMERLKAAHSAFRKLNNARGFRNGHKPKTDSATHLRPDVIEAIRKIYFYIYASHNEATQTIRDNQLKQMETIVKNTPKRKYVRKVVGDLG